MPSPWCRRGRHEQAEPILGGLARSNPTDVDVTLSLAGLHASRLDWEQALPLYRAALERRPEDPAANLAYGQGLLALKRYDAALGPLDKATRAMPSNGDAGLALARALRGAGDLKKADGQFERILPSLDNDAGRGARIRRPLDGTKEPCKGGGLLPASPRPRPEGRAAARGPGRCAERERQAEGGLAVSRGGLRDRGVATEWLSTSRSSTSSWARTSGRSSFSARSDVAPTPVEASRRPRLAGRDGSGRLWRVPSRLRPLRPIEEPRPVTPEEIARLRSEIEHETRSSVELLVRRAWGIRGRQQRADLSSLRRARST